MRMRHLSVVAAVFAFLAPVSNSALELAHGLVHQHEAVSHEPAHDLAASVRPLASAPQHESLHAAQRTARLAFSSVDAALPTTAPSWEGTTSSQFRYPADAILIPSPPPDFGDQARAPPAG